MSRTRFLLFIDINYNNFQLMGCYETLQEALNARERRRMHILDVMIIYKYTFDENGDCTNLGPHYIPREDDTFYEKETF